MEVFRPPVNAAAYLVLSSAGALFAAQPPALESLLLSGASFTCFAQGTGTQRWPCTIKFSGTAGDLGGEVAWGSLGSVHRIKGSLSGHTLRFTEVSAIRAGAAHLNAVYSLTYDGNAFTGTWVEAANNTRGTFTIQLGATLSGSPPGGAPVDLNGSWQRGLLHIWQDGPRLVVTATWKRDDGKWVIWKGSGTLNGRTAVLEDIQYSPMPHGAQETAKGYLTVSPDGDQIRAYYVQSGQRDPASGERIYQRDR